jgi:hypothetical protein
MADDPRMAPSPHQAALRVIRHYYERSSALMRAIEARRWPQDGSMLAKHRYFHSCSKADRPKWFCESRLKTDYANLEAFENGLFPESDAIYQAQTILAVWRAEEEALGEPHVQPNSQAQKDGGSTVLADLLVFDPAYLMLDEFSWLLLWRACLERDAPSESGKSDPLATRLGSMLRRGKRRSKPQKFPRVLLHREFLAIHGELCRSFDSCRLGLRRRAKMITKKNHRIGILAKHDWSDGTVDDWLLGASFWKCPPEEWFTRFVVCPSDSDEELHGLKKVMAMCFDAILGGPTDAPTIAKIAEPNDALEQEWDNVVDAHTRGDNDLAAQLLVWCLHSGEHTQNTVERYCRTAKNARRLVEAYRTAFVGPIDYRDWLVADKLVPQDRRQLLRSSTAAQVRLSRSEAIALVTAVPTRRRVGGLTWFERIAFFQLPLEMRME